MYHEGGFTRGHRARRPTWEKAGRRSEVACVSNRWEDSDAAMGIARIRLIETEGSYGNALFHLLVLRRRLHG